VLVALICVGVALAVLVAVAGFTAWKVYRSDERRLARRIGRMQFGDKLALGRDLFRDPRVPFWARFVALGLVLYMASPIDLIPDFIPVLGLLDDVLVIMAGAGLLLRAIPREVVEEHVAHYEEERHRRQPSA